MYAILAQKYFQLAKNSLLQQHDSLLFTAQLLLLPGFNIIPPSTVIINCTSYGEVSNFSMTWQPQDMRDFTVIVYPNQTFNNTTTPITFQYEHVIPFTVSIIQQDCTEDIITTFILSMLE